MSAGSAWLRVDATTFQRARTACKRHHCSGCTGAILQGDRYWQWAATPDNDSNSSGRWQKHRECRACADRYGRPVPPAATTTTTGARP